MSIARFKVVGQLDGAGGLQRGIVEIDRETGEITVRAHKRRRRYTSTLGVVATMVCQAVILAELREKKKAKKRSKS